MNALDEPLSTQRFRRVVCTSGRWAEEWATKDRPGGRCPRPTATLLAALLVPALTALPAGIQAQETPSSEPPATLASELAAGTPRTTDVPTDYVIGPEDVLNVHFRYDEDLSGQVTVRPDGKISLPLVRDVDVAGLTIEEARARLTELASGLFQGDPAITVQAVEIHSRKVFIDGNVAKVGAYPLLAPTSVLQLIATAGGLLEWAKQKDIVILRTVDGRQVAYEFNYNDVKKGKNLQQNILLKPGDTVVVP
jgi:polysaccharide export outer membrane protein